jgi:opacity protein-like surface antigen
MLRSNRKLLCFALVLVGTPAAAEDPGGFYLRAFGGLSGLQRSDVTVGGSTAPLSFSALTLAGGAIGYNYGDSPWRSEIEFAYRSSEANNLAAGLGSTGEYASTSIMLNGRYTFQTSGAFQPYVGAGVGYVTEIDFDLGGGPNAGEYSDRGLLAGQMIIGADMDLGGNWALFGEARYFVTESPTLKNASGATLSADYRSLDLLAGITYSF